MVNLVYLIKLTREEINNKLARTGRTPEVIEVAERCYMAEEDIVTKCPKMVVKNYAFILFYIIFR